MMPRINYQDEEDIESMFAKDVQQRIDKKNHSEFRKGMSLDNRKRDKVKRKKIVVDFPE